MTTNIAQNRKKKRNAAYRLSITVAIALAVITGIEYVAGLFTTSAIIMFLIGLVKAYLVVVYFMHVRRVWAGEEGH